MLNRNKKGISEIVVTIIIILLAIVVFAVVSVVVRGTVTKGAENIELSANCLEVEMHATKLAQAIDHNVLVGYDVTLSRSGSGKELEGVKLILEDAAGNVALASGDLIGKIKPLDKKTERVLFGESVPNTFLPAKVTVVPFFMKKSGDIFYCENTQIDELVVSTA